MKKQLTKQIAKIEGNFKNKKKTKHQQFANQLRDKWNDTSPLKQEQKTVKNEYLENRKALDNEKFKNQNENTNE